MTNMPWTVYKCAKLRRGQSPHDLDQTPVSHHLTASEAMDAADAAKKADRGHSYMVGESA